MNWFSSLFTFNLIRLMSKQYLKFRHKRGGGRPSNSCCNFNSELRLRLEFGFKSMFCCLVSVAFVYKQLLYIDTPSETEFIVYFGFSCNKMFYLPDLTLHWSALQVDWDCLRRAAEQLGHLDDLPQATPANYENDEDFLKKAHHALLEIELINGNLVCPETSRKFPVSDGIPNMLLNEDEI